MKKILSGIALIAFGTLVQAQTDFHIPLYPQSVQEICGGSPFELETPYEDSEDADKCTLEMTDFLEPYIRAYYEKAMEALKSNKQKESRKFKELERKGGLDHLKNGSNTLEEAKKDKSKFLGQNAAIEESGHESEELGDWSRSDMPYVIRSDYISLLEQSLNVLLPSPKYPKSIQRCLAKAGIANETADCNFQQLKYDEKAMNANFQKVLAKSADKTVLQTEQKNWLVQRVQMCNFGNIWGQTTTPVMVQCQDTLTRARNAWLESLLQSNTKK